MILLYRGTGLISSAIQWQTRSPYSHAAWLCADGSVFEAWHLGGVQHSPHPFFLHGNAARFDVYAVRGLTSTQREKVERFLARECGQPYDFRSVLRFLSRRPGGDPEAWFCSELVAEAMRKAERPLLKAPSEALAPGHLSWSNELTLTQEDACAAWWVERYRLSEDYFGGDKCHGAELEHLHNTFSAGECP